MKATLIQLEDTCRAIEHACGDLAALTDAVGNRLPIESDNDRAEYAAELIELLPRIARTLNDGLEITERALRAAGG